MQRASHPASTSFNNRPRRQLAARLFTFGLAHCSLLALSCSQGNQERVDPFANLEPEKVEEPEPEQSAIDLAAELNAPTEEPVAALSEELSFACDEAPDGRVVQRLNRLEYDNTVRDLLGDDSRPARNFPRDDFGDSFDNNARALSVSPLLTEAYLEAAQTLAASVMAEDNPTKDELVPCSARDAGAENCARAVLTPFLSRAFRRPLFQAEVDPYVAIVLEAREDGAPFEDGLQAAIEASLLSVNFLFRLERDVDPESGDFHALTQFELASRLSYFLWSSLPDAELYRAAGAGELTASEGILVQVDRMLEDPKARALSDSFAARWLEISDLSEANAPAPELFPEYTPDLKAAMEAETRLVMEDVLSGELPFSELLTTRETYVNNTLAAFYELGGDFGNEMEKVSTADTPRKGLLTHASFLTLTGAPTRTSPARRGVYVLSNLLCSPPPPPPPDVQGDLDVPSEGIPEDLPLAEKARLHSLDPVCAGCHRLMDPIGFGLENFDAIGRYRTLDQGQPIESAGTLMVDGEAVDFEGASELADLLSEDKRLAACATRKLYTFALGRIPTSARNADGCRLDWLRSRFEEADYDFRELIRAAVLTDSFRGRRGGLSVSASDETGEDSNR